MKRADGQRSDARTNRPSRRPSFCRSPSHDRTLSQRPAPPSPRELSLDVNDRATSRRSRGLRGLERPERSASDSARRGREGREDPVLHHLEPRWLPRDRGPLAGVALPARRSERIELSGVHRGGRRARDGLGHLRVAAPSASTGRRSRSPGPTRSRPGVQAVDRNRRSLADLRFVSGDVRPVHAAIGEAAAARICGSRAAATSSASSTTPGCSTRSSSRSAPSPWFRPAVPPPPHRLPAAPADLRTTARPGHGRAALRSAEARREPPSLNDRRPRRQESLASSFSPGNHWYHPRPQHGVVAAEWKPPHKPPASWSVRVQGTRALVHGRPHPPMTLRPLAPELPPPYLDPCVLTESKAVGRVVWVAARARRISPRARDSAR